MEYAARSRRQGGRPSLPAPALPIPVHDQPAGQLEPPSVADQHGRTPDPRLRRPTRERPRHFHRSLHRGDDPAKVAGLKGLGGRPDSVAVELELVAWPGQDQRMPTTFRRAAAQQERERRQARRLRAAELFAAGLRQAEVARQSVSDWHARWQAGGPDALRSQGPTGPTPRLSDRQLGQVEQVLLKGPPPTDSQGSCEPWTASGW